MVNSELPNTKVFDFKTSITDFAQKGICLLKVCYGTFVFGDTGGCPSSRVAVF